MTAAVGTIDEALDSDASLPPGWTQARIEEVCSKVQDGTHFSPKEQTSSGDFKYVTAKNIKIPGVDLSDVTYISESVHRTIYSRCNPEKGDVLYIKDGATAGIATINQLKEEFSLLSSVALLKPCRNIVHPGFLKWYLNSPAGRKAMTDQVTGSAITRIILQTIRQSVIPIAPIAEQRRVTAKIDNLLERLVQVKGRLATVSAALKRFRQSVLAAACSGRLTAAWREQRAESLSDVPPAAGSHDLPTSWCMAELAALLAEPLANGRSVPDGIDGFPVLRLSAIRNGRVNLAERKIGAWTSDAAKPYLVCKGDFLVARGNGSISLVGRGGLVERDPDPVAYPDTAIRVRLTEKVDVRYFALAWDSEVVRKQVETVAHTTAGIHKISQKDMQAFLVPVPPLAEQHEIVRRVDALFKLADAIEARVVATTSRADKLTQAILSKAFRGELVPTEAELARRDGRDYEPASNLLERIRAERAAAAEKPKSRRRVPSTSGQSSQARSARGRKTKS